MCLTFEVGVVVFGNANDTVTGVKTSCVDRKFLQMTRKKRSRVSP